MKKIYFWLFALCCLMQVNGQTITIGSGTSVGNKIPVAPYFGFSYSQQIVLKTEINAAGSISKLRFYSNGTALDNTSNNWTIYMGHTTKTAFANNTDWIQAAAMTQVFSGTVTTPGAAGWMEITLSTPFAYNNVDNLVVSVDENAASFINNSSANYFRIWTTPVTNRGIYYNNDTTNPDPASIALTGTRTSYIAQMQLEIPVATDVAVTAITGVPSGACPATAALAATLRNDGTNTLNFATTNATVTLNVTGASTQSLTGSVTSGTLAPGATVSVNLSPSATLTAAGTHTLTATVAMTGDGNAANNSTVASKVISAATASPYTESFTTTTLPTGWANTGFSIGTGHGTATNGIYKNLYSSATTGQFNMISVGPVLSTDEFKFDYRLLNYNTTYPGTQVPPSGNWGNFKVQISTDCGNTFTDLQTISNANHTVTDQSWTTKTYPLTSYVGQYAMFRIVATWVAGDYYLDIDNFSVAPAPVLPPNCASGFVPATTTTAVSRNASISWSAATGSPTSYDVFFGTSTNPALATNTTGLTYTPPTMLASTTYYWKIVPKNANGSATGCTEQTFVTGTGFTYCTASFGTGAVEAINNVTFAGINNSVAGTTQYENFTAISGTVVQGSATNAISVAGTTAGNYTDYIRVYIDWNQDGNFSDATNERYDIGTIVNCTACAATSNIAVPAGAVVGSTRMRIIKSFNAYTTACVSGNIDGQIEDYTINVTPMPTDTPDYVNLQFPATATISAGGSATVYARVYEGGLTDTTSGQAPGIEAWIGISPAGSNSNPNTWTTWVPATFNVETDGNNNDEYQANIGSTLVAGTYYYASRFRLNGGPYVYGGNPFNQWDGSSSISGVLTVNPNPTQCATMTTPANAATNVTIGTVALNWTAPATGPTPTGYKVYFGTVAGTTTLVTTTAAGILTYNASAPAYSTTYYWRIVPTSTIGGDATGCTEFNFTTQPNPFAPYCSSVTYSSTVEPITLVNFAGINNASSASVTGQPSLENFISATGNVTTQTAYAMTLKGNTNEDGGGPYTNYFRVFIDWNKDGDFSDTGESIDGGSITNSTGLDTKQAVTSITIPATASAGITRMRIKKLYATSAPASWDACTGGSFGQSEDYSLNVTICTPVTWYADADGDGFGNPAVTQSACNAPVGYVANNTDCNDNNNAIHATFPFYVDADGDTYGTGSLVQVCAVNGTTPPAGYSVNNTDCNDGNAAIHATFAFYTDGDGDTYGTGSAVQVCAVDANTPPTGYSVNNTDCDDANAAIHQTFQFYVDADGDTYGTGSLVAVCAAAASPAPAGYSLNNTDCDDTNAAIHQTFQFYVDADGDTYGTGSLVAVCAAAASPAPAGYSLNNTDCDDSNASIHQTFQFYVDADGDTYGAGSLVSVCATAASPAPVGYSLNNTDCDDTDNTKWQSATLYVDADNDGYTSGATSVVCYGAAVPSGYVASLTAIDCNDTVGAIHPNATEVPYNAVDDDCDGIIDETGTVTTTLLASSCGTTLTSIGSLIGITTVAGQPITGYRIRATNGAQVQVIERNVPHFTMTNFPSYAYATTYTIDIQVQRAGVWQAFYGAPCLVSTPAILEENGAGSINPSQCGITLAKINTLIATTSLAGVTGYRFRVTNLTDPLGPNAVQTIDRTQNWFSLQMLTRYNYGTLYRIEVAVKTTGTYGGFGSACEVSSPPVPSLVNCGGTVAAGTTTVAATSLAGATQYRFQITRQSDNASSTIDRGTNYFTFNMVPAVTFTAGALYTVRVAVMTTGTWSPFGDACEITAPGGSAKGIPTATTATASAEFKAAAFPNPFTADFQIDVTTSSQENVQLKVYDMLGKLVESREVKVSDLNMEKVGAQYPSGVYNVIVSQDGIVKTLRVIKR